jgi:hypothetical protein
MKTSTTKMSEGSSRVVSKIMKMKLRWKIEKFSVLVNELSDNSFIDFVSQLATTTTISNRFLLSKSKTSFRNSIRSKIQ